jgi:hypothetical protein
MDTFAAVEDTSSIESYAGASGVSDPKAKLRRELPYRLERGSLVSFGEIDFENVLGEILAVS